MNPLRAFYALRARRLRHVADDDLTPRQLHTRMRSGRRTRVTPGPRSALITGTPPWVTTEPQTFAASGFVRWEYLP